MATELGRVYTASETFWAFWYGSSQTHVLDYLFTGLPALIEYLSRPGSPCINIRPNEDAQDNEMSVTYDVRQEDGSTITFTATLHEIKGYIGTTGESKPPVTTS